MLNRRNAVLVLPIVSVALFGLAWHLAVTFLNIPSWLIPAPAAVVKAAQEFREALWESTLTTLYETLVGFGLAIFFGLGMAILFGGDGIYL